jgi:hypothetical protein
MQDKEDFVMARTYPTDTLQQARDVLEGWKAITTPITIVGVTQTGVKTKVDAVSPVLEQIASLEAQLTNLRNQRDAMLTDIWSDVKRIRAGVKANFGDNSSQFEMVGGTRMSERKPPTHPPAPTGT